MTDEQQHDLSISIAQVLHYQEVVKTSTYYLDFLQGAEYDLTMTISEIIQKYEVYTSDLVIERAAEVIGNMLVAGMSWPEITPSNNRTLHLELEGPVSVFLEIGNTTMNGFIRAGDNPEILPTVGMFPGSLYPRLKAAICPIVEDPNAVQIEPTQEGDAPATDSFLLLA
jgi:hypothetical protein